MILQGIGASPGLALGPVHRLEFEELAVHEREIGAAEADAELELFQRAIEVSRRELAGIRDGIGAELGPDEAAIYDAHLLILDDPELKRAVEAGVRKRHRNAAWVFRRSMASFAAAFDKIEDEYLRERQADILDVERRVLRHLLGTDSRRMEKLEAPVVVVAHDLGPSEVASLPKGRVLAFVTEVGGRTSHGAIVARGRGIPAIVSVKGALQAVRNGMHVAVDGFAGTLETEPDPARQVVYAARVEKQGLRRDAARAMQAQPSVTLDGRLIELGVNLEQPEDVGEAIASGAESIGLFRTEFFYLNRIDLPNEEEQYAAYSQVCKELSGRPVLFRTMDLGGDKVASYLGVTHETNPFLGLRGIRLALTSPDMFRTQLRAIHRAAAHGRARLMFPMVSSVDELERALALRDEALADLKRGGLAHDPTVETGIMIETPSAVWMADALARRSAFFSIGSNDLTQYTLAMDRDNERLAGLYEPLDPSILRSIAHTVRAAQAATRWVGVCGEMAGDPHTAVLLVGLGVEEMSMSAFDLPRVKAAVRSIRHEDAKALAEEALTLPTAAAVRALVRDRIDSMLPSYLAYERLS